MLVSPDVSIVSSERGFATAGVASGVFPIFGVLAVCTRGAGDAGGEPAASVLPSFLPVGLFASFSTSTESEGLGVPRGLGLGDCLKLELAKRNDVFLDRDLDRAGRCLGVSPGGDDSTGASDTMADKTKRKPRDAT